MFAKNGMALPKAQLKFFVTHPFLAVFNGTVKINSLKARRSKQF